MPNLRELTETFLALLHLVAGSRRRGRRGGRRHRRPASAPTPPLQLSLAPCAVHGWACPNRVALAQGASSSGIQGEEEGRVGDEDDACQISVVVDSVGSPVIRRIARITIDPRGRP
jgi:hypothetical protein